MVGLMAKVSLGYGMPYGEFLQTTRFQFPPRHYLRGELSTRLVGSDHLTIGDQVVTGRLGLVELFMSIGDSRIEHIMLFPTLADKELWHLQNTEGYDPSPIRTKTKYLDIPFLRYNHYMDGNGVDVEASPGGDPALVPGIPPVMREWLTRFGVFDMPGIAKLRPMASVWQEVIF